MMRRAWVAPTPGRGSTRRNRSLIDVGWIQLYIGLRAQTAEGAEDQEPSPGLHDFVRTPSSIKL